MRRQLRDLIRFDNWWDAKVPPLLAIACLAILRTHGGSHSAVRLATFIVSIVCVAAYGHVVNDIFDREADRRAGKPNASVRLGAWASVLLPGALAIAGFVPGVLANYSATAMGLLFLNYLWPTLYSVPPLRLKERGLWGVAADAAGSHVTPTLFALAVFAGTESSDRAGLLFSIAAVLWSAALGVKGILHHQVRDWRSDIAAGVSTFATRSSTRRIERFLVRHNLFVELPVSALLVGSVAAYAPLAAASLLAYLLVETVKYRLGFQFALNAHHCRASIPFANEIFYTAWLPAAACVQLAVREPAWVWLPLLVAVVFRSVYVVAVRDLRAVARALFQRLGWSRTLMPPAG